MVDAGIIVLTSFISPFEEDRNSVRKLFNENKFIEIFVEADLETCEIRDPKGLYKKARTGKIKNFTGISSPYEKPENAEIIIDNGRNSKIHKNTERIINYLKDVEIVN